MPQQRCDTAVIGSGPGGYVAAIRAAQLGQKTILIEKDPLPGGTCLHRGCIPTKALLHSASVLDTVREAAQFGVKAGEAQIDFAGVQKHKNKVVRTNAKGIEFLMKKNGVTLLTGAGRLAGKGKITVRHGGEEVAEVHAKNILIATGSAPRSIPNLKIDGRRVITSDELLEFDTIPKSLIVLGAGAVGVEFATVFNRFGSEVTLIEMLPRILPIEDEDCSAELDKALKKRGIRIHTGVTAEGFEVSASGVSAKAMAPGPNGAVTNVAAEHLLVAVGRRPVTDGLGIENTAAVLDRGFIKVDGFMRCAEPGLYAIGDVAAIDGRAHPQLAHVASAEGVLAAEHIAGREVHPINYDLVPSCTYCEPEVASVGLSERTAKERGHDVRVGKFPWTALGKAKIIGATEGFVKIVTEAKYGEILGVHIVGPHATELIAEAGVAMKAEATIDELVHTIHAHPTLAEGLHEAAHGALGSYLHM